MKNYKFINILIIAKLIKKYIIKNNIVRGSETSTIYRIHISNTAGLPQKIDRPNVLKGIKVKRDHYRQLSEENERYNNLYLNFNKIHKRSADKSWLNDYIEKLIINKIDYPFWWENIRILK